MSFELFIGFRYLKAKRKQAFLSIITVISTLSVAIGVMTLITVLGVMSGFENDLKEKILGTNAHIRVFKPVQGIENYPAVATQVKQVPGVKSTTPFIYTEAMLSTQSAVSGIILLGIDPHTVTKVTNLKQTLIKGKLDNLLRHRGHVLKLNLALQAKLLRKLRIDALAQNHYRRVNLSLWPPGPHADNAPAVGQNLFHLGIRHNKRPGLCSLLGLAGMAFGLLLGVWLIVSILRSRKL